MNKLLIAVIFILECFALPVQYFLLVSSTELTVAEATVRFFSYFTILTNSLVAICCGFLLLPNASKPKQFFSKNTTLTAITVYILIVGLVFNIILRHTVDLKGLHLLVSEIFHTLVPLLFLFFWIWCVPKQALSWNSLPKWMSYPLAYVLYTLIHGIYSGFYPYPFIDAGKLGFSTAMTNGLVVLLAFVILSALLIAVGKLKTKANVEDRNLS